MFLVIWFMPVRLIGRGVFSICKDNKFDERMQKFSNIFFSALLFRHLQNQSFFSNKTGRRGSLPKSDFGGRCVVENHSFRHSTTQGISFSFNVLAQSGGRVVTKVRHRVCACTRYIPNYRKHILCLIFPPNLLFLQNN